MDGVIDLLLIDDHTLFREGLVRLLAAEPGFQIAGDCSDLGHALEIFAHVHVDIVLLDYDLGSEQGTHFLDALKRLSAETKILMVTAGMDEPRMSEALARGASGIFLKHSPPVQLVEAIRRVMDGHMWLDPGVVKPILSGAVPPAPENQDNSGLLPRERSVLRALLEGSSNKEIAFALRVSESSVKAVLQRLFARAGVRTRSQLVRVVLEKHVHDWLA
jgi:DNA-binding NarL/FixJ family response regulator